jgi:hypothetical protein
MNKLTNEIKSDNGPWWIQVIYKVGIPSAIAIFLIWALVTRIDVEILEIRENLRLHAVDSSYIIKNTNNLQQILQRICVNTSETNEERNACFQ